jgi:hypothetical protein
LSRMMASRTSWRPLILAPCDHDLPASGWCRLTLGGPSPDRPRLHSFVVEPPPPTPLPRPPRSQLYLRWSGAQLIAGAVGNLMDQQCHFHQADTVRPAERAKTPDTLLGLSVNTLKRLTQVASSADLAPVWWALAPDVNRNV